MDLQRQHQKEINGLKRVHELSKGCKNQHHSLIKKSKEDEKDTKKIFINGLSKDLNFTKKLKSSKGEDLKEQSNIRIINLKYL